MKKLYVIKCILVIYKYWKKIKLLSYTKTQQLLKLVVFAIKYLSCTRGDESNWGNICVFSSATQNRLKRKWWHGSHYTPNIEGWNILLYTLGVVLLFVKWYETYIIHFLIMYQECWKIYLKLSKLSRKMVLIIYMCMKSKKKS